MTASSSGRHAGATITPTALHHYRGRNCSHFGCPRWSCGSLMACADRASLYERGEAQEGFVLLEVAVPFLLEYPLSDRVREVEMVAVIIGMDPHKRSATIEVMAGDETVLGGGRYATDAAGYRSMLAAAKRFPDRTWAVEGCQGIGRHIANRLLADGEPVLDVPPKLSARTRMLATGQGRKTDETDAHSVALVGTRMSGLRPVVDDEQLAVLRILVDRRRSLGEDHTRMVSQLHQLLLELIPGGAKKDPVGGAGQSVARDGASARCRGQDPAPGRGGVDQRPGADLCPQEGREQRTQRAARSDRHHADRAERYRPLRCCSSARRGR